MRARAMSGEAARREKRGQQPEKKKRVTLRKNSNPKGRC